MRATLRDRPYALLCAFFVLAQSGDAALTAIGLHIGVAREGNPAAAALIARTSLAVMLALRFFVLDVALFLLLCVIRRLDRTIGLAGMASACCMMLAVVGWNIAQIL